MKNHAGFTLLELLLAILCAAVVAVAALSLLHVGIRMGGDTLAHMAERQQVQAALTRIETLARDGTIQSVASDGADWALCDASGTPLFSYEPARGTLCTASDAVLLSGLTYATAALDAGSSLLTVTLEAGGTRFESSVLIRVRDPAV